VDYPSAKPKDKMYQTLEVLEARLPATLPRYLMGVGFPADLVAAVERGVDLFDCVAPTRGGRNGSAFTPEGTLNIRNAAYRTDDGPLDPSCDCETCTTYSRGYLRHFVHRGRITRPPPAVAAQRAVSDPPRGGNACRHPAGRRCIRHMGR